MLFKSFVVFAVASVSLAATPQGFQPATESPLMVSYNGIDASGGKQVAKEVSQKQPQLAMATRLTGTSYAVMMVDLDIPTTSPPQTSTLLHWMQTGLIQSSTATVMNTTAGVANVYVLEMPGAIAAAASYIGPAPPARTPLSHRYTQVLIDTSSASPASMSVLMQAAQSRQGFNAEQVLTQAGLQSKVVAGNFFMVTNPGPAVDSTTSTGTGTSAGTNTNTGTSTGVTTGATIGNSTTGTGRGTGTGTAEEAARSSTTSPFTTGSAVSREANLLFLSIALVGAAYFSL
ncbi:phosphatidylethanolamine-binding protein [Truncatella angustata]|uniref:Phosphatidylethanolamine-binding protein n=1 Tax=Truncatella angustata TaxID=152316 RepID=A0A9P8ZYK0_9PEZI|nr:phosphatidylethanolamine-binding protein [Truncatella angustata]KAH6655103.1 phosphatidylethanolamine-binding protein [Truncatella angustata]KAH8198225.1 hypothetical protein TruAng_007609 [Truncatella angustata]